MNFFKSIKTFNTILAITFLFSLISVAFSFQAFDNAAKDMFIVKVLIFILAFSVIYFIAFTIWISESKTGKKYEKYRKTEEKTKLESQVIYELDEINYYNQIPQYTGKDTFGINIDIWRLLLGIGFPILTLLCTIGLILKTKYNILDDEMLWPVTILLWICTVAFGIPTITKIVVIEQDGVRYKKIGYEQFIPWDKIKTIGISVSPSGRATSIGYVYFLKKEIKGSVVIQNHYENKQTIVLSDRPELIHCILQYWDKEIVNLNKNKAWKEYLDKLGSCNNTTH